MSEATLEHLKRQEAHYQQKLVEVETAYTEDSQQLIRLRQAIKSYETAQAEVRQKDERRSAELAKREQELKAGWRALNQERQDLEAERKEFYKTRELQA